METETFNSCTHVENALLKRESAPVEPDVWERRPQTKNTHIIIKWIAIELVVTRMCLNLFSTLL